MLFSYAECNLREYMKCNAFAQPTKRNVLWLLAQFEGLSEALREIHNLSNSDTTSESTMNLLAPRQDVRKSGWHHDLKPQNILYFKSSGSKHGRFQIADFGSGKVHTYRSGSVNTRSPNGTLTYEPPEAAKEGATSRPYDIWSMGCVFLEIMIWAVYGYTSVKSFAKARRARRFPDSTTDIVTDDAFWQIDTDGEIHRRSSVTEWLKKLDEDLGKQNLQLFRKVLDLIDRMLDTDRLTRISALDLWDTLFRISTQTRIDLADVKSDSIPEQTDCATNLPLLPRLSTKAPDRRTPEPISPAAVQRAEGYASHATYLPLLPRLSTKAPGRRTPKPISPPAVQRAEGHASPALWTGGDLLTASPVATSITRAHRRNSTLSGNSDGSDVRIGERSASYVSSTHVQDGSSNHSNASRTPDASNTRTG